MGRLSLPAPIVYTYIHFGSPTAGASYTYLSLAMPSVIGFT